MKRILFLDFENALLVPAKGKRQTMENLAFSPGVFVFLGRIAREMNYELGLINAGKASLKIRNFVHRIFENEGIHFSNIQLSDKYESAYDLKNSYIITASSSSRIFKEISCNIIQLNLTSKASRKNGEQRMVVRSWEDIYKLLGAQYRKVTHQRTTRETSCTVEINLDGNGKSNIKTGLHFFDHMLDQLSRHGSLNLTIKMKGDLEIDEHHTIEDTAITLGEAFSLALGDKRGIERYGFCLPMDDALAQVAIDFGGRNNLVWQATFKREKIGDVPTEMLSHFFKSFSDAAKCNLNIHASGENEHHKIEAIFKAFAKAIKMAVQRDLNNLQLPSTKGIL